MFAAAGDAGYARSQRIGGRVTPAGGGLRRPGGGVEMTLGRGHAGDRLLAAPITRRRLMQAGAGAGAGLVMWRFVGGRAWAQPLGTSVLDAASIPQYARSLVIPPAMPRSGKLHGKKGRAVDYYRIAVRPFEQEILPAGMGLG